MRFFLIVPFILLSAGSNAQQIMRGMVVDSATYAPLPFVSIQIKNKFHGTTSDSKGNFSIQATENDTLIFSIVGYHGLEFPLFGYETSLIPLREKPTMLAPITILDKRLYANPYEGMFDDPNEGRRKRLPFYYTKARKDGIRAARWREESLHVQTYIDVVINDPSTKSELIKKHKLTEDDYYEILTRFNEQHHKVMYHLSRAELLSLINRFFEITSPSN